MEGQHCHFITWVDGFSIKDRVHLDCFLRRRKRQLEAQLYTHPARPGHSLSQLAAFCTQGLLDPCLLARHVLDAGDPTVNMTGVGAVCTKLAIRGAPANRCTA